MKKIYTKDNYVIVDLAGVLIPFTEDSVYVEGIDSFLIKDDDQDFTIGFSEIATFFNLAGDTAFSESTLRTFLRQNTGF